MKLAVFDFDSTLMQGETLEFIAKASMPKSFAINSKV